MMRHMLLQFPLLLLAGWLLAQGLPDPARTKLGKWNHAGVSGLLLAAVVTMFWMIPRALDMVLSDSTMELCKFITLVMAGMALELSWQAASLIVRGFFLGNLLPMMMVVGWLYIEAPVRICNAYLTDDQLRSGSGLLGLAIAGSVAWLIAFFMSSNQLEKGKYDENL
ncbi:MAG TPA: hypothetical protein VK149_13500 [Sideroxyarcus sp.]|nr:hypothetical protein [Sideroxyarcus sp.]